MTTEVKDVVSRLRERAVLHSKWDRWELGDGPAPAALKEGVTAAMLFEAATEIEAAESRATAAEGRVALLEEALTVANDALLDAAIRLEEWPCDDPQYKTSIERAAKCDAASEIARARLAKGGQS